jgi:predicted RNase H-like nuclease (RuvC/YqgF family)
MGANIAEWLGYLVAGGAAAYSVWKKFIRSDKEADARSELATRTDEVQLTVIEMMRGELERMNNVNEELAKKVNAFQLENITLRAEIAHLTRQIVEFKEQNQELRVEVEKLNNSLENLKGRL